MKLIQSTLEKIGLSMHEVPILDACPLLDDDWIRKKALEGADVHQAVEEAYGITKKY